jgi:aromatic ring-opening dioxygenase LigB subunit
MSVRWAAILPHGGQAIPELAGDLAERFRPTREGLETAAGAVADQIPSTIVIATPHGIRAEGGISISASEFTEGVLEGAGARVQARYRVDVNTARAIAERARSRGLEAPLLAYGASSGPHSCLPMDWGVQVPLHFLAPPGEAAPSVVSLCPSRLLSFEDLARFGEAVADIMIESSEPMAFVASADLAHAHQADGPYGYHPAAREMDAAIVRHVQEDRLEDLFALDPGFIADAKPDALWQTAILAGLRRRVRLTSRFIAYDCPTYFGMLSACYLP